MGGLESWGRRFLASREWYKRMVGVLTMPGTGEAKSPNDLKVVIGSKEDPSMTHMM